ncbi:MAG: hypothetical protein ACI8VC_002393 [Candidatus Endobugula sp.]|jgi:hypothetical protein
MLNSLIMAGTALVLLGVFVYLTWDAYKDQNKH